MKKFLNILKNNKIKFAGYTVSALSFILTLAGGAIESKQLEETVDEAVDAKIASIINEATDGEDTQNEK